MKPTRPSLPLPSPPPLAAPEGFADRLAALGVSLDPKAIARLGDFLGRLLAMNEQMNLTAIDDPIEAWERHVLDALTLLPLLAELGPGSRVIDIGSGGGVPAIPLAIARPDLSFCLVEATQKKAAFLGAVAEALSLDRVSVRAERAEQLLQGGLAGAFDAVTARAVGRLDKLVPITAPFAKYGGRVLLIKGQRAGEEIAEAAHALRRHRAAHEETVSTPTGKIVVLRREKRGH